MPLLKEFTTPTSLDTPPPADTVDDLTNKAAF
jgi:hypothetical protein